MLRAGPMSNFVIGDICTVRLTAWLAVLIIIDFSKQLALVKVKSLINIPGNFSPADIEDFELDVACALGLSCQKPKASPGRLQFLKPRVMNDLIDLSTDRPVYLSKDRKSTRLNSSHVAISYAVFCLKKKIHYIRF